MNKQEPPSFEPIIDAWEAATTSDEEAAWAATYRADFSLELLDAFKTRSDGYVFSEIPERTAKLIRGMQFVTQTLAAPIAVLLIHWTQGNASLYQEPARAVEYYQHALQVSRTLSNAQYTVRLLGNLLGALCEIGDFAAAQNAYAEIAIWEPHLSPEERRFLLTPEQNYALYLDDIGDYQQALIAHERARTVAIGIRDERRLLEIDINRALTLGHLGELDASEHCLLNCRSLATKLHDILNEARVNLNLAVIYTAQARPADALHCFYFAQHSFLTLHNQMEAGTVLLHEARLLARIGAFGEASRHFRQAQQQFSDHNMTPQVGLALLGAAVADRLYGRYDRAYTALQQARQLWETLAQPDYLLAVTLEEVALLLGEGKATAACQQLQQHLPQPPDQQSYPHHFIRYWWLTAETYAAYWRETGKEDDLDQAETAYSYTLTFGEAAQDHEIWRDALVGLARLVRDRNPQRAYTLLVQAQEHDDLIRQALSVQELKASFLKRTDEVAPLLATLAVADSKPVQALAHVWHAKGNALMELITGQQAARANHLPASSKLEQALTEVRQRLAARRWQLRQQQPNDWRETDWERTIPEIQQLNQQLQSLRRQRNVQTTFPAQINAILPARRLQQLGMDLLIEYFRCDDQIWALRIDCHGEQSALPLVTVEKVYDLQEELLLAFSNVLDQPGSQTNAQITAWLAECQPLLEQCYALLLAPLGPLPAQGHCLLAPCETLFGLPFGAFRQQGRYLIESMTIEFIPTGALLTLAPPQSADGQPMIIAASAEGRLGAVTTEVAAIQQQFPAAQVLIDMPGVLQTLQTITQPPRFLHIAAHTTPSDYPLQTAFHLTDELLTVEQCYELNLHGTEFVTLSGCNTSVTMANQDLLLAWQSAFMIAGAQRVISTLWPIADAVTAHFMDRFYQHIVAHITPHLALQQAQRDLLSEPTYCHPAFWAPFVCYRR